MALAKRESAQISADPNNTRWARDTTTFGQRVLRAQGWTPGSLLGATEAPHAEFFTAASSTHIRARVREDGLGIGWTPPNGGGVPGWGGGRDPRMDAVENVLARLNGQSEAQVRETETRQEQARARSRFEQRYGRLDFVSAGFLVGDDLEKPDDGQDDAKASQGGGATVGRENPERTRTAKKRSKVDAEGGDEDGTEDASSKRKKRRKEERSGKAEKARKDKTGMLTGASAESTPSVDSEAPSPESEQPSPEATPAPLSTGQAPLATATTVSKLARKERRKKVRTDKADAPTGVSQEEECRPDVVATAGGTEVDESEAGPEPVPEVVVPGEKQRRKEMEKKERKRRKKAAAEMCSVKMIGPEAYRAKVANGPESIVLEEPANLWYDDVVECMVSVLTQDSLQQEMCTA